MPKAAKKAAAKKLAAKKLATKRGSQSRITGRPPQPPRRPTSASFRKEGAPEVETLAYILQSLEDIKKELVEKKMVGHLEGPYVIYIRKIRTGRSIIFDIAGNVAPAVIDALKSVLWLYTAYMVAKKISLQNEAKKIENESNRIDLERKQAEWDKEKNSPSGKLAQYLDEQKNITTVAVKWRVFYEAR